MSDVVPETADKAIREFLGAIGFTLVLTGGEMMADKEGLRFWIGVILVLCAIPVYLSGALWNMLKPHLNQGGLIAINSFVERLPWWFRGALIVIIAIVLSQIIGFRISLFPASAENTVLRLQFYGDHRVPTAIGIPENVHYWYAQFSPSMDLSFLDKEGNEIVPPGGAPHFGPSWNVFVVMERPFLFRQIISIFSNPGKMGPSEIVAQTDRSFIFHSLAQMPDGVLELRGEQ